MIRNRKYKLVIRDERFYNEFYDMNADPGESNNLYGQKEYEGRISEMRKELEDFLNMNSIPLYRCENMTVTGKGQIYSFSVNKRNAFNEGMYYIFPKKAKNILKTKTKNTITKSQFRRLLWTKRFQDFCKGIFPILKILSQ